MYSMLKNELQNRADKVKEQMKSFIKGESGLMDAVDIVKGLVMIVVVGAIGVFVADRVVTTTGTPTNANLSAMQTNVLATGETGSDFLVILVIAFIGGIAISYLAFFGAKEAK